MAQFIKKRIVVQARQLTRNNWNELLLWVNGGDTLRMDRNAYLGSGEISIVIRTPEGDMRADVGDWIIREPFPIKGREFYPCKPDIFTATYDPVPPGPPVPPEVPGPKPVA